LVEETERIFLGGIQPLSLLRSLSPAQKCRDHAWTAPTVQHRDHDERLFLWYVGNQVIPHSLKSKRSGGEIGTVMALARERYECADCFVNLLAYAVGCVEAIGRNIFPDFVEVFGLCTPPGGEQNPS